MIRDVSLAIAVAVLPVVVTQLGEGVREALEVALLGAGCAESAARESVIAEPVPQSALE